MNQDNHIGDCSFDPSIHHQSSINHPLVPALTGGDVSCQLLKLQPHRAVILEHWKRFQKRRWMLLPHQKRFLWWKLLCCHRRPQYMETMEAINPLKGMIRTISPLKEAVMEVMDTIRDRMPTIT